MKAAVLAFPGSNCDRDLAVAFARAGFAVSMIWHRETSLPVGTDVVGVPGGFSYGDYLRCGAIAARSPIAAAVARHAEAGGYVLAPCNGFQILTEMKLLPGALLRNAGLKYVCARVSLTVEATGSPFTARWGAGHTVTLPIAHHEGNFVADRETLARLRGDGRIALRYVVSPNGATDRIAGIVSANRRVLGLMPHPERACEPEHGGTDGAAMFRGLAEGLAGG